MEKVKKIFAEWLAGYEHSQPSDFFFEFPTKDPYLVNNIQ